MINSLTRWDKALLFSLALFDGRFSKNAARACFRAAVIQGPGQYHPNRFERALDRLCLAGAVISEQVSERPAFSLEGDLKAWLRDQSGSQGPAPYEKRARKAMTNYLAFLDQEIRTALTKYDIDPHAVDTASPNFFMRLEPEARHIDNFLSQIWTFIAAENASLPAPEISHKDLPELWPELTEAAPVSLELRNARVRMRQIVWLGLFCSNLALYWEAANLAGTAVFHLRKAADALDALIEAMQRRGAIVPDAERQIRAIRTQILLSHLHIEVRLRRNGFNHEWWNELLGEAKKYVMEYDYGQALFTLIEGMIINRRNCAEGLPEILEASKQAIQCAHMERKGEMLLMMRMRQPIARYLSFMAQRELVRVQIRAGCVGESIMTGRALLRVAKMTREPRLIAEALIALTHSHWFQAIRETEKPLSEADLHQLRTFLFQSDAYIAYLVTDKATLRSHYLTLFGLYNIEKGLSMQSGLKDHINERRAHGEGLFATGIAQVSDLHFRGIYFALIADSYIRFSLVNNDPMETENSDMSEKQKKLLCRSRPRDLAISYFVRSLDVLVPDTYKGYALSEVVDRLFKRICDNVESRAVDAAIIIHYKAEEGSVETNTMNETTNMVQLIQNFLRQKGYLPDDPLSVS